MNFAPSCLSGSEWLIVIALAARSDDNWFSSLSIRELSTETGLSAQTCRKTLNALSEQEFIIISYADGATNTYKVAPVLQPLLIGFRSTPYKKYEGSNTFAEVDMDFQPSFPVAQTNSGDVFDPAGGDPLYFLGGVINSIRGSINVNTIISSLSLDIGFTSVNPIEDDFENPVIQGEANFQEPKESFAQKDTPNDPHSGLFLDETRAFEMQVLGVDNPGPAESLLPPCEVSHEACVAGLATIQNPEYLPKFRHEIRDLAYAFAEKFGRGPTKSEYSFWVKGLREQLDIGLEPDDIRRAYDQMIKDHLTIKSPKSVTAVAFSLKTLAKANDPRKYARESGGVF